MNSENLLKRGKVNINNIHDLMKTLVSQCNNFKLHKKPTKRPVGGISKANYFNYVVAKDLLTLDINLWYLHTIVEFSQNSNGVIVKSKNINQTNFIILTI